MSTRAGEPITASHLEAADPKRIYFEFTEGYSQNARDYLHSVVQILFILM